MNFKVGDYIWLPNYIYRGLGKIERIDQQGVLEVYFDNIGRQFVNIDMPAFRPSKVDLPEIDTIELDNNTITREEKVKQREILLLEIRAKIAEEAKQRDPVKAAEMAKFSEYTKFAEYTKQRNTEQAELRAKLAAEETKRITQLSSKDRAIELHKQRMIQESRNYLGIRTATSHHRASHCYSCHHPVDNTVDVECVTCNWIICCACGACGCGYVSNVLST